MRRRFHKRHLATGNTKEQDAFVPRCVIHLHWMCNLMEAGGLSMMKHDACFFTTRDGTFWKTAYCDSACWNWPNGSNNSSISRARHGTTRTWISRELGQTLRLGKTDWGTLRLEETEALQSPVPSWSAPLARAWSTSVHLDPAAKKCLQPWSNRHRCRHLRSSGHQRNPGQIPTESFT